MVARVSKWGNSLAVRLPREVAREAKLRDGEAIELTVEAGRVVIAACAQHYSLGQLLRGVTPKNLHTEKDAGASVGSEVW